MAWFVLYHRTGISQCTCLAHRQAGHSSGWFACIEVSVNGCYVHIARLGSQQNAQWAFCCAQCAWPGIGVAWSVLSHTGDGSGNAHVRHTDTVGGPVLVGINCGLCSCLLVSHRQHTVSCRAREFMCRTASVSGCGLGFGYVAACWFHQAQHAVSCWAGELCVGVSASVGMHWAGVAACWFHQAQHAVSCWAVLRLGVHSLSVWLSV
jgi:hypothetical protein